MIQSVANFIFTEGTWFLIIISLKMEWIKVRVKWAQIMPSYCCVELKR